MGTSTTETDRTQHQETSSGLDPNVAATVAYVLGWLTGLVLFVVESDNDHVRFHAAQSIVVFGALFLVSLLLMFVQGVISGMLFAAGPAGVTLFGFVSMLFGLLSMAVWLLVLALWVYLLVKTYQGKDPRVPVAAGIADDLA